MNDWRAVMGGVYEVTSDGRVKRALGGKGARLGKELRRFIATTGYVVVNVCVDGKKGVAHVHSLVAEAHIGPRPAGMEINHKDGDKGNCAVSNLEYVTRSENGKHAWRTGLQPQRQRRAS
jgi:hypothetical protein